MLKNFYEQLNNSILSGISGWMFVPTEPTKQHIRSKLEDALKKEELISFLKKTLMQLRPPSLPQQQGQQSTSPQQRGQPQQGQQSTPSPPSQGQQQQEGKTSALPPDKLGIALVNAVAYFLETNIGPATRLAGRVREFDPQQVAGILLDNYFRTHAIYRQKVEKVFIHKASSVSDNNTLAEDIANFVISLADAALKSTKVQTNLKQILQEMLNIVSSWLQGGMGGTTPIRKQLMEGGTAKTPTPPQGTPQYLHRLITVALAALERGDYTKFGQALRELGRAINNPAFRSMPQFEKLQAAFRELETQAQVLAALGYDVMGEEVEGEGWEEGVAGAGGVATPPTTAQQPQHIPSPTPAFSPQQPPPTPPSQQVSVPPLGRLSEEKLPEPHLVVGMQQSAVDERNLKEFQEQLRKVVLAIDDAIKNYVNLSANIGTLLNIAKRYANAQRVDEVWRNIRLQSELLITLLQRPPEDVVAAQEGQERMEKQRWRGIVEAGKRLGRQLGITIFPQTQQAPPQPSLPQPQYSYPIIVQLEEVAEQLLPQLWKLCQISGTEKTSIHNYVRGGTSALRKLAGEIRETLQSISTRLRWAAAFGVHLQNMADEVDKMLELIPENSPYRAMLKDIVNISANWRNLANNIRNWVSKIIAHLNYNLVGSTLSIVNFFASQENRQVWGQLARGTEALSNLVKQLMGREVAILLKNLEILERKWGQSVAAQEIRENVEKAQRWWNTFVSAFHALNFPAAKESLSHFEDYLGVLDSALAIAKAHDEKVRKEPMIGQIIDNVRFYIRSTRQTALSALKDLEELIRRMDLTLEGPPSTLQKGEGETSFPPIHTQKSFPDPWRRVRGGGRGKRWSWDINLPKQIISILQWWDRLTPQERDRIRRCLYEYWLSSDKDERKEALQKLIRVAQEMGIPV